MHNDKEMADKCICRYRCACETDRVKQPTTERYRCGCEADRAERMTPEKDRGGCETDRAEQPTTEEDNDKTRMFLIMFFTFIFSALIVSAMGIPFSPIAAIVGIWFSLCYKKMIDEKESIIIGGVINCCC